MAGPGQERQGAPDAALPAGFLEALARVPELAAGRLELTPLSGGITNRNFRIDVLPAEEAGAAPSRGSGGSGGSGGSVGPGGSGGSAYVVRLAGNDTHLLGISREVEHAATVMAAGLGIGPQVVAFLRPEGYLVTRFIEGRPIDDMAIHQAETLRRVGRTIRRLHDGPAIPGIFVPDRVGEAYRALAADRGVAIPASYGPARAAVRRVSLACLARPEPLAPCHNDLLNANFIDDGERIRIVDWEYAGMGDPFFDLGNVAVNHELLPDEEAVLLAAYDGLPEGQAPDPARLARLRLMRVVSDFREAMWGVLQQALSSLDVDFVAYADEHFERLLAAAAEPSFEADLALLGAS